SDSDFLDKPLDLARSGSISNTPKSGAKAWLGRALTFLPSLAATQLKPWLAGRSFCAVQLTGVDTTLRGQVNSKLTELLQAIIATFGAAAVATNQNPNKSIEVRCWEISHSGTAVASVPKASISHDHPVLCST
ncbi:hypothetical protein CUMW_267730, partial [Citrus unshiu]